MKRLLLLVLLILSTGHLMAQRVKALDAGKFMSEYMNVWGKVHGFELSDDKKTMLLYLGADLPQQDFTIIIEDITKSPIAKREEGMVGDFVSVYGKILLYKGKPAIKVKNWEDVAGVSFKDS